jgi:hypothetical protein
LDFLDSLYDEEEKFPSDSKTRNDLFDDIDFSEYQAPESEETRLQKLADKDPLYRQYKVEKKSREELAKMPWEEKKKYMEDINLENEYLRSAGFTKGALSGLTFGVSERADILKPQEYESSSGFGELVGATAPLSVGFKAINALGNLMNFGKTGKTAYGIASSSALGSAYTGTTQLGKGKEFDVKEIVAGGLMFGGLHAATEALFKGVPAIYRWVKDLKPSQQSDLLVKGKIPDNFTPNEYKFYQDEVLPKIQEEAQKTYEKAYQEAVSENNKAYEQKLNQVKVEHERELYERGIQENINEEEFAKAQEEYENKLRMIAAEHEQDLRLIQQENQKAIEEVQGQKQEYQKLKSRENLVRNAIEQIPEDSQIDLLGRISQGAEDLSIWPKPIEPAKISLETKIGSVISPNSIESTAPNGRGNTTTAGKQLIEAVKANDAADYQLVNEAYKVSDELNAQINFTHPQLIEQLERTAEEIRSIPEASPPQKQLLGAIEKILGRLRTVDANGNITGFLDANNRVLQEQAKAFRYFMDFNFEHANARGIFSPTVGYLENAVEAAAEATGNEAAAEASKRARGLYRQWAQDYDNAYIRPYRDTRNFDYSKTFKSALDVDEYNVVNNILQRTNASQQVSGVVRRELVQKHLMPFLDNPKSVSQKEFDKVLRELGAVINSEEEQAIRQTFAEARRTPVITGKKIELPKIKEPKNKVIESVNIPLFKAKKKELPAMKPVKIPLKPEVKTTKSMQAAAKIMKSTPEEIMKMTDTPSGLKKLKSDLKNHPELIKKMEKVKTKQILFEGNVERQFKGDELYRAINKGDNYSLLAEMWGEEEIADILVTAKQIGNKKITVDRLKKLGLHASTLKTLVLFGVL